MAAFAAVVDDPLLAAIAATATLTVSADRAAERPADRGRSRSRLLDELAAITPDELAAG